MDGENTVLKEAVLRLLKVTGYEHFFPICFSTFTFIHLPDAKNNRSS